MLVVDDNATNRLILEETLSGWGMKPGRVDSGPQALAVLDAAHRAGTPFRAGPARSADAGHGRLRRGRGDRADPELAPTTLMMLTSSEREGQAARCRELGVASLPDEARPADRPAPALERAGLPATGGPVEAPPRSRGPAARACGCCWPKTTRSIRSWHADCWRSAATRSRSPTTARARSTGIDRDVRRGAHGRADAGAGRVRGRRRIPASSASGLRRCHHRHDRPRHERATANAVSKRAWTNMCPSRFAPPTSLRRSIALSPRRSQTHASTPLSHDSRGLCLTGWPGPLVTPRAYLDRPRPVCFCSSSIRFDASALVSVPSKGSPASSERVLR